MGSAYALAEIDIYISFSQIGIVKNSVDQALSCIDQWMSPKKGWLPLLFFPASRTMLPEPLGVVLILGSWNFPISLILDPLIGAISAGNTVMLKPSELAPNCASFLAKIIPVYLDPKAIKVTEGGKEVSKCVDLVVYCHDGLKFVTGIVGTNGYDNYGFVYLHICLSRLVASLSSKYRELRAL
ncbi:hypothetical protein LXL04_038484 [Taraxacum kok-saghyz]